MGWAAAQLSSAIWLFSLGTCSTTLPIKKLICFYLGERVHVSHSVNLEISGRLEESILSFHYMGPGVPVWELGLSDLAASTFTYQAIVPAPLPLLNWIFIVFLLLNYIIYIFWIAASPQIGSHSLSGCISCPGCCKNQWRYPHSSGDRGVSNTSSI